MKKSMSGLGLPVWAELSLALEKAGFTPEFIFGIINSKDNRIAIRMREVVSEELESFEEFFELSKSFQFTVPEDYSCLSQLETLKRYSFTTTISAQINSERCVESEILEPGKKYLACLYTLLKTAELHRIKLFLEKQKSIRVGLPGLSLLIERYSSELFNDVSTISFGLPGESFQSVFTPGKLGSNKGMGRLGDIPVERIGTESCLLIIKEVV